MQDKNVVVIGGGPGTDIALMGLKRHTSRLTALISTFDASSHPTGHDADGSTANGSDPADEVRSSLLALGANQATTHLMERLFAYRFDRSFDMGRDSFGNLFLAALREITGGTDLALQAASQVLNVHGQVLPLTLRACPLLAELNDGAEARVSTPAELISAAEAGLRRVTLSEPVVALESALRAIRNADIIVLGPADFYFNVLAPLQLEGVCEALAESNAVKIFVCNIMTQPNTTGGWPASRFIRMVLGYTGGPGTLDCVIVNSAPLSPDCLAEKAERGHRPVRFDLDECLSLGLNVIMRPVAATDSLLHDAEKLARTILFLGGGRSTRSAEKREAIGNGSLLPSGVLTPQGAES